MQYLDLIVFDITIKYHNKHRIVINEDGSFYFGHTSGGYISQTKTVKSCLNWYNTKGAFDSLKISYHLSNLWNVNLK